MLEEVVEEVRPPKRSAAEITAGSRRSFKKGIKYNLTFRDIVFLSEATGFEFGPEIKHSPPYCDRKYCTNRARLRIQRRSS